MFAFIVALATAQVAAVPPSEIRKTDTRTVVVSDVRYRGPDRDFPKPHDFEKEGVGFTNDGARLCSAAHDMEEDASAPTGWKMEAIIIKAAGIDSARDDEATIKRKTAAWLAKERGRNGCTGIHALFKGDASWMQAMIQPTMDGYRVVDRIIVRYGLPLNDVALRDGRTVLDFVADKIDEGQNVDRYKRIYGTLRRLGALHRKELEASGALASSSQRKARLDAEMEATGGNLAAMWALTNRYAEQGDAAKAAQWLQKSISTARAGSDSIIMTEIGLRLVDTEGKAKAPFAGRRAEAIARIRSLRGPEWHWAFREGKTFDQWLSAQPEGICGRDSHGGDPCK